jgi:hypothetical protein
LTDLAESMACERARPAGWQVSCATSAVSDAEKSWGIQRYRQARARSCDVATNWVRETRRPALAAQLRDQPDGKRGSDRR